MGVLPIEIVPPALRCRTFSEVFLLPLDHVGDRTEPFVGVGVLHVVVFPRICGLTVGAVSNHVETGGIRGFETVSEESLDAFSYGDVGNPVEFPQGPPGGFFSKNVAIRNRRFGDGHLGQSGNRTAVERVSEYRFAMPSQVTSGNPEPSAFLFPGRLFRQHRRRQPLRFRGGNAFAKHVRPRYRSLRTPSFPNPLTFHARRGPS